MAKRKTVLAILDTMWGDFAGRAPRSFKINPLNHSGRRLYKLVGNEARLFVANSCPKMTNHANKHAKPDPKWLAKTLSRVKASVILVCGRVARRTFRQSRFRPPAGVRVLRIPHPAARTWTKGKIRRISRRICKALKLAAATAQSDSYHRKCELRLSPACTGLSAVYSGLANKNCCEPCAILHMEHYWKNKSRTEKEKL
jgi:hypothetical protein